MWAMVASIVIPAGVTLVVLWAWQFFNWAWVTPRKTERLFRKQGMKGNPYQFLFGDSKETARMYKDALSKPIAINDDTVPRLMPNIYHAIHKHGSFCFTWAGPRPRIFILDPNIAKETLKDLQLFINPYETSNHILNMLITGLARRDGDAWRKSRSRANPAFKIQKLKPMVPAIEQCCEKTIKEFREMASKGGGSCIVDVSQHFTELLSSLFTRLLLNCPYTDEIKETFEKLDELAGLIHLHARIYSFPGEKYIHTKRNRRANELNNSVRASFTSMIEERLKTRVGGDSENTHKDLLDIFMEDLYEGNFSNKNERHMIVEEIIADMKLYFFASIGTTANLLAWALVMLASHQDIQNRARQEVFQVLGNKNKDDITPDDVSKLKYMTMVVNETLRLYPPVMELSRVVGEDSTIINGYMIPKGTLLTFPLLMYQRSREYWGDDAGKFNPQRFAEGVTNASKGDESPLMPFGWGPRMCIGMNFAMLEGKIALAMFLCEFSFEVSQAYKHAPCASFTVHPQFGLLLCSRKSNLRIKAPLPTPTSPRPSLPATQTPQRPASPSARNTERRPHRTAASVATLAAAPFDACSSTSSTRGLLPLRAVSQAKQPLPHLPSSTQEVESRDSRPP